MKLRSSASSFKLKCLSACFSFFAFLIIGTSVQAQKKPLIFKTEDDKTTVIACTTTPITTTSAQSMEYIHELERCYKVHRNAGEFAQAALERNILISIGIEEVDAYYEDSQEKGTKRHQLLEFLFDFLEIGASSAISIVKGERPRAMIAEGLSLFQGSRSAFNKDFKFLEWNILVHKMDANRSNIVIEILNNTGRDANAYSWETARAALQKYLRAGTVTVALRNLSEDTAAEAKPLKDRAERLKSAGVKVAPTGEQYSNSRANDTKIQALLDRWSEADSRLTSATTTADQTKATADRAAAFENLKSIYKLIEKDSTLSPLLERLPDRPGLQPNQKQRILDSLARVKDDKGTFEDYARLIQNLNALIIEELPQDSTLNDRLKNILSTTPK